MPSRQGWATHHARELCESIPRCMASGTPSFRSLMRLIGGWLVVGHSIPRGWLNRLQHAERKGKRETSAVLFGERLRETLLTPLLSLSFPHQQTRLVHAGSLIGPGFPKSTLPKVKASVRVSNSAVFALNSPIHSHTGRWILRLARRVINSVHDTLKQCHAWPTRIRPHTIPATRTTGATQPSFVVFI